MASCHPFGPRSVRQCVPPCWTWNWCWSANGAKPLKGPFFLLEDVGVEVPDHGFFFRLWFWWWVNKVLIIIVFYKPSSCVKYHGIDSAMVFRYDDLIMVEFGMIWGYSHDLGNLHVGVEYLEKFSFKKMGIVVKVFRRKMMSNGNNLMYPHFEWWHLYTRE